VLDSDLPGCRPLDDLLWDVDIEHTALQAGLDGICVEIYTRGGRGSEAMTDVNSGGDADTMLEHVKQQRS